MLKTVKTIITKKFKHNKIFFSENLKANIWKNNEETYKIN